MFERDPERVYDLRTLQRNLERGLITREQYQKHLDDSRQNDSAFHLHVSHKI